ncbi:MAG: FAD-binding oxidoreductase [Niameybacter sp.]
MTLTFLRTTPDHRLIISGEDISFVPGIFNEDVAKEKYAILEQRLKNMFPHIPDIEVEYRYCGAFASTPDNIGFIGKDPNHDRLYYSLGYGANGILFAILAGLMLPSLYKGHPLPAMDLFKSMPFRCFFNTYVHCFS